MNWYDFDFKWIDKGDNMLKDPYTMYGAIFGIIVMVNIIIITLCWYLIDKCQRNNKYGKQGYSKQKIFDSESNDTDDDTEEEEFEESGDDNDIDIDVQNELLNDQ